MCYPANLNHASLSSHCFWWSLTVQSRKWSAVFTRVTQAMPVPSIQKKRGVGVSVISSGEPQPWSHLQPSCSEADAGGVEPSPRPTVYLDSVHKLPWALTRSCARGGGERSETQMIQTPKITPRVTLYVNPHTYSRGQISLWSYFYNTLKASKAKLQNNRKT